MRRNRLAASSNWCALIDRGECFRVLGSPPAMAEDLVLHYQGVNRLLGSPARLNRALAVAIGVLLIGSAVRLLSGGRALGDLGVFVRGVSGIPILVPAYAPLPVANPGPLVT